MLESLFKSVEQDLGVGTSLAVQWLRFRTSTAGGTGLIPGQGLRLHMPHGAANKKKKVYAASKQIYQHK